MSVIIPTYNRSGMVCRAIDSVLRQSFVDFELLVIDDGSTDDTPRWIKSYVDPRLSYHQTANKGVAHARNFGAKLARGDWLCFLDSDDVWRRHKLSEQVRFHKENPDILISQTDDIWIRKSRRVNKTKKHTIHAVDLFYASLDLCLICASSVMIKKSLFAEMGGFDENLPACEDYDLWLKITAEHKVGFVKQKLVTKFGGHTDQLSKQFQSLDEFRIESLRNLLQNPRLTQEQKHEVQKNYEKRTLFIKNGKAKTLRSRQSSQGE